MSTVSVAVKAAWTEVIFQAISGKYESIDREHVAELVELADRTSLGRRISELELDILRQAASLRAIETKWKHEPVTQSRIIEIFVCAYLDPGSAFVWRSEHVDLADDMITPVRPESILSELASLDRALDVASRVTAASPRNVKLDAAARVFCEIIRIHPFPDGNGRTARLVVNLLMRSWDEWYLAVPKVRNRPDWLASMKRGIEGDISQVAGMLETFAITK